MQPDQIIQPIEPPTPQPVDYVVPDSAISYQKLDYLTGQDAAFKIQDNKDKRYIAKLIFATLTVISVFIIIVLTRLGFASNVYSEVQGYSSIASIIGWIFALASGFLAAYMTARPVNLTNLNNKGASAVDIIIFILAAIGLLFGGIPGIIIIVLYYILKKNKPIEPTATNQLVFRSTKGLMVFLGFIFGLIPGAILAFVVIYPLSNRACELSGSKYC